MKQQYQTRYELLHENYQKWLTGFTRHAVSWGVCHPNIYYFHNLTPLPGRLFCTSCTEVFVCFFKICKCEKSR